MERHFPLGQIRRELELEVAAVERVEDKQDEVKYTHSKYKRVKKNCTMYLQKSKKYN